MSDVTERVLHHRFEYFCLLATFFLFLLGKNLCLENFKQYNTQDTVGFPLGFVMI